MSDRIYVLDGAILECNCGFKPGNLLVTKNKKIKIQGKFKATDEDIQVPSTFGQCKLKPTSGGYLPCTPALQKWTKTSKKGAHGKNKSFIFHDSQTMCATGGVITVKDHLQVNSMGSMTEEFKEISRTIPGAMPDKVTKIKKSYFAKATFKKVYGNNNSDSNTSTPSTPSTPKTYSVKPGDSISKIAKANGTTVDAIVANNKAITQANKHLIKPGQIINLSKVAPTTYTVKSGDFISRIAKRNGLTVDDIIAANANITHANKNRIKPGQVINLSKSASQTPTEYIVKSGDSIGKIAKRNGLTVDDIVASNSDITNANKHLIKPGQKIILSSKKLLGEEISFEKVKDAAIGEEVYLIVETESFEDKTLKVYIKQGEKNGIANLDSSLPIQENKKEVTAIKMTTNSLSKSKYLNKDAYVDWAITKITLQPKDEKKLKIWNDKLDKLKDKKTSLYILVDAHTDNEDIEVEYKGTKGNGDNSGKANHFLNKKGEWLEFGGCACCNLKVDKDGFFISDKITKHQISALEKAKWSKTIKYIILHRTVTPNVQRTFNSFKNGIGTHFLVGMGGDAYQTATLDRKTYHIRKGYNHNSIGIECVGRPFDKAGKITRGYPDGNPVDHWDPVSDAQAKSVACIVKALMNKYNLSISAIKNHEDLQAKAKDEGNTVYKAIINLVK